MPHIFYGQAKKDHLVLDRHETEHIKVVRLKKGDMIKATDGKGTLYTCVLNEIKKDRSTATIKESKRVEEIPTEAEHTLCIASQGWGRLRWIVEKSVELGVDRLIIYKSVRSRSYKDKYNKVQLIVRDSAKQCERYAFPEVLFFEDFSFLSILKGNTVVLHKSGRPAELKDFKGRVNLIVGPEGDFTQEEADMLAENGTPISFGRKILRFETAAILSVGLVAFLNGKI